MKVTKVLFYFSKSIDYHFYFKSLVPLNTSTCHSCYEIIDLAAILLCVQIKTSFEPPLGVGGFQTYFKRFICFTFLWFLKRSVTKLVYIYSFDLLPKKPLVGGFAPHNRIWPKILSINAKTCWLKRVDKSECCYSVNIYFICERLQSQFLG